MNSGGASTTTLWLAGSAGRLAVLVCGTLNLFLLVRYLDPEARGEYFLFLAALSLLTVLGDCGVSQGVNVYAARSSDAGGGLARVLWQLPIAALAASVVTLGIAAAAYGILGEAALPNFSIRMVAFLAMTLPLNLYAGFWTNAMVGLRRIVLLNCVLGSTALLNLALTAALVAVAGAGAAGAMGAYAGTTALQLVAMVALSSAAGGPAAKAQRWTVAWREIMHFGVRIYPGAIATLAWTRLPVLLLNSLHGPLAVGHFSVAQQVTEKLLLPVNAAQDAIYQRVTTLPPAEATAAMNRYLRVVFWAVVILALLGIVGAPWGVALLFGESSPEVTQALRALLLGMPFTAAAMALSPYFLGQQRRPGLLSAVAWVGVAAVLTLGIVLSPSMGAAGAAAALAASQALVACIVSTLYLRLSGASLPAMAAPRRSDVLELLYSLRGGTWRTRASS